MSEKKESVKTYILGKWDTRTIVGVAIGAALFGVLMNFGGIRVFTNTSLTTAMLVDVIVGGLFGAVPAAVAAFFGNVISDLIGAGVSGLTGRSEMRFSASSSVCLESMVQESMMASSPASRQ